MPKPLNISHSDSVAHSSHEQVDDGRPKSWTEALCLSYIGTEDSENAEVLAALFMYGDWNEIHKEFPLFVKWMNERSN